VRSEIRSRRALNLLNRSGAADWAQFYSAYHRALIADLDGRVSLADRNFDEVTGKDPRTPRLAMAHAQARAARGDTDGALRALDRQIEATRQVGHPMVHDLRARIEGGAPTPRLIATATDGLAEVFHGLGSALSSDGGAMPIGVVYVQLALALKPDFPFAIAALANIYETLEDHRRANETYERMPQSLPLSGAIRIRQAINLDAMERIDEARKLLEAEVANQRDNREALEALANMLRSRKFYGDAIPYYTRLIEMAGEPQPQHWVYWYARGTCYERIKNWPAAEVDLLKAKELNPDQPLILNYLGYSWVDQNRRLDEGLKLIDQAVSLKPDDGYIVDSLGWAYYRLGKFKKAVKHLERAVELQPEDPILNDHLGDALWRVGRRREARFQWKLSLAFEPQPDDVIKIRTKLSEGLPPANATRRASVGAPVRGTRSR